MFILGGQVLISFFSEAALEPGFAELPGPARATCAAGLVALIAAVGLAMWPAPYHLLVCNGESSPRLLRFVNRALCVGMPPFALGLAAAMYIAGQRAGGSGVAVLLASLALAAALMAWGVIPVVLRRSRRRKHEEPAVEQQSDATPISHKIHQVLTEARMVLPGAQALLGFGSIAVLMDAFKRLPATLKLVHVAGLCFIALAVVLLMTPAAYHRIVEDGRESEHFHRVASRLLLAAMAALAPGLAAALWLVLEITFDSRAVGIIGAAGVVPLFYSAWFGWTLLLRARSRARTR